MLEPGTSPAMALDACLAGFPDLAWDDPAPDVPAERRRQQSLLEGMHATIADGHARPDSAGVAIQGDGAFRTTFWFTGDLDAHRTALEGLAPEDMVIEVLPARLTLTELEVIGRVIGLDEKKLRRQDIVISTVGTDLAPNSVEVGLRDPNDEAEAILQRRYGPHVMTALIGPISEDADTTP